MGYYDDVKNKKAPFESHYISAYGLAVKHGYKGTEEEWIAENDIARAEVLKNKEVAEAAATSAKWYAESANGVAQDLKESYEPHLSDKNNPHGVTASQVGAYTKEEVNELIEENKSDVDLSEYVKNTDYATADVGGVIRIRNDTYGLQIGANDGIAFIKKATNAEIDARTHDYKPIVPANLEYAVKSVGDGYYVKENEVIPKIIITGQEIDGTEVGVLPDYIYGGSIANFRQDFGEDGASPYPNVPFTSALIFTLSPALGGAVLGDEPFEQIAISDSGKNGTLIWHRTVSQTEAHPTVVSWKSVTDIELNANSYNPIANSTVAKVIGDIETALDGILAMQESLIGGDA